jgi:hypothetical protein
VVTRFARIGGGAVIAAVVLTAQWPAATRVGEAASAKTLAADVTVHEWGTFTTVAGEDGRAVEWLPLGGPIDLPCFVYSFNRYLKFGIPAGGRVPDYTTARRTLKGTVRMETPVLYFYATRPAVVDVSVQFRKGLFSEWYPDAVVNLPANYTMLSRPGLTAAEATGSMFWKDVRILPHAPNAPDESVVFPVERRPSHYYAARMTDASPVQVKGELEKFLFYRGVAGFDSPITATLAGNGTVTLSNRSGAEIPQVMLFTRHGSQVGYRVHAGLRANQQVTLDRPAADRSLHAVTQELERTLVAQGLYVKEAKAMIATWRDSWFEDGTRLFYIVPPSTVDAVLPLAVTPKPTSVVRVFVGRAELIDSADIAIVATALTKHDHGVLERYGRLLAPIADRVLAKTSSPAARAEMSAQLDAMLKAHAARLGACGAQPAAPTETAALLQALATPW